MSKRKEADAAYERQEDQRALVIVLAAASEHEQQYGGNDPRLVEAIERVKRAFLKIEPALPPKPEPGQLPGQLAIDGSVVGDSMDDAWGRDDFGAPMASAFDVPEFCPKCDAEMLTTWGGHWTPMHRVSGEGEPFALQCGHCGHVVVVSERQHEAVVAERKRTIGASDKAPPPKKAPRVRGAG